MPVFLQSLYTQIKSYAFNQEENVFSFLKNNQLQKTIFLILLFSSIAQVSLIFLFLLLNIQIYWVLVIPFTTFTTLPVFYNIIRKPFVSLTGILSKESLSDLKKEILSGGDSGKLASTLYQILEKKAADQSELSLLKLTSKVNETEENQHHFIYNLESVGRLAGGIAHDFNNILGAISGYSEIIITRYPDDEKLQKYGKMILSAANRASDLTNKLLQFAHKSKLNMSCFDAGHQLISIIESFGDTLNKSIKISLQLNAEDSYINGDINQFQNVITNIVINAQEAMPLGGNLSFKTENITVDEIVSKSRMLTVKPGYYLAISISDTGKGMNQEEISHLFEPFYTTKDRSDNNGLALASAYGIIRCHNGFIDVKSDPGKGSIFTIYLPIAKQQSPEPITIQHKMTNSNILLVDDEAIIQDAVGEMLNWLGFRVTIAANGEDAIELIKESPQKFDLIILDMVMPGMNGRECYKKLKEINPSLKVLVSTGYSCDIDPQQLLEDGILGILEKPYESSQLTQAIYKAMRAF